MNYLDELLALYPGRDWHTQRYFLSQLSSLAPGLETDALLEFLWGETASERPELRHMARRQLGRVLPGALRQAYGLEETKLGIWTAWAKDVAQAGAAKASVVPQDEAARVRLLGAAWHRLSPLLARALGLMGKGSHRVRLAASLVAGRIRTRTGMAALSEGLARDGKVSFWHASAIADLAAAELEPRLLEVVRGLGARAPDMAMLLTEVAPARALEALAAVERVAGDHAATGVALALAGEAGDEGRPLLERLIKRGEPWVTAYALDALAACPAASDLALAQRVFDRENRDFLRVAAVKVAGALPGAEAANFLLHVLKAGPPRVKAAALESLARKRVDPERVASEAAAALTSPLLKLRVNAMLVLARQDPQAILDPLDALLSSDEAVERVEGAFVLGYLKAPSAAQTLGELATADPRLPVRLQAIKSLAKQDAGEAIPRLLAAARSSHARTAGLAARALASLPEEALAEAVPALEQAAGAATSAVTRGVLLRALGIAASRRGQGAPKALEAALADKHEPVVLGALEGLKGLGGPPLAAVKRLAASPDGRVRYRAAVAAFLTGEVSVVHAIDELLTSPDDGPVLHGLQALLEIGILLPIAISAPPFDALRAALDTIAAEAAVRTFSIEEQPAAPQPAAPAPRKAPVSAARFDPVPLAVPVRRSGVAAPSRSGTTKRSLDSPLARQAVEGATYLAGMPVTATWREWLATYRALVAAAAVLAGIALMVATRVQAVETTGPAAPLPSGGLRLTDVKGKVERGLAGKPPTPAAIRGALAQGERVTTGPAAQAMLSDGHGNVVCLGPNSQAVLAVPPKRSTAAYVLDEASGDILVDFQKSRGVEVNAGPDTLSLETATVRITDAPGGRTVAVVAGEATVSRAGGAGRKLVAGQTVELKDAGN